MVMSGGIQVIKSPRHVLDNTLFTLGNDNDAAIALVSDANSLDDEIANLIVGTSDHQGTADNSLVFSNVTNDGDIQMLVSDGGNSKEFLLANGDTADLQLGHGMATATLKTASGNLTLNPGGTVQVSTDTFFANATGVVIGHTAQLAVSATDGSTARVPEFQITGTVGTIDGAALITTFNTNGAGVGNGSTLNFAKSRGSLGTIGTAVGTSDALGAVVAYGDDGTDMHSPAGAIYFQVDGTVGTGVMPGKIEFYTTPASSETLTKRMTIDAAGDLDLHNNDLKNVGSSGDGWTSDTLTINGSGTFAFVIAQNSDNALEIKDSAGTLLQVETRPGLTNARFWDFIAPASTVGATGRNDINQHLMRLKAYTVTMAGTTTVTGAWQGMMLELGVPTIVKTDSGGSQTITTASSFHIEAIQHNAGAGDNAIVITNNRMISTSVSDCYLTSAGVWTDTSSTRAVKDAIIDLPLQKVGDLIKQIRPRTYRYNDRIGDDHGRTRYGAVAEEFPDFLRVPGDASNSAVNGAVLGNFALVASVYLADKYEQLNERLEAIGA
jgi:hypothetical protein